MKRLRSSFVLENLDEEELEFFDFSIPGIEVSSVSQEFVDLGERCGRILVRF